jgi:hypothetical protein
VLANGTDVMFARSTDSGQTFSAPVRINDDPINHNKWHFLARSQLPPNGRMMSFGMTPEALPITSTHSCSIHLAPMVA